MIVGEYNLPPRSARKSLKREEVSCVHTPVGPNAHTNEFMLFAELEDHVRHERGGERLHVQAGARVPIAPIAPIAKLRCVLLWQTAVEWESGRLGSD
eukprot:1785435-Prymnesium_polylepis.1